MVLMVWYIFVFGGVSFVYMCDLVVDWVRLCFGVSKLACVYVCFVSIWFCVCFVVGDDSRLLMRAL